MGPTRIDKVRGYSEQLLDAFRVLKQKYALLEPITFHAETAQRYADKSPQGLVGIRNTLVFSCVQDIAKLFGDKDQRTPSVRNLAVFLEDDELRAKLRDTYSVWELHFPDVEPEIMAILEESERREEEKRRNQFDQHYDAFTAKSADLKGSDTLAACRTIRNKLVAHTEVRHDGETYTLIDVADLGLKSGDIGAAVKALEEIVELITLICRAANFDFTTLEEQTREAAVNFWAADAE